MRHKRTEDTHTNRLVETIKLLLIFLVSTATVFGQTKMNSVETKTTEFITNDLKAVQGKDSDHYLFEKVLAFDKTVLADSTINNYFTTKELRAFNRMRFKKGLKWNFSSPGIHIVSETKLDSFNRTDFIYYSYSSPLLSKDGNRILVTRGFFCGLLCGGGATFLYEKRNGIWERIQKFNEWGE